LLHRDDEFRELAEALNRLVEEFASTLARVHALVDRTAAVARGARDQTSEAQLRGLVGDLDQAMAFFRLEPRRTIREG